MSGAKKILTRLFFLLVFVAAGTGLWGNTVSDSLKNEAYRLISAGNSAELSNHFTEAEKKYTDALAIWEKIEEYDEYRAYPFYSLAILHKKRGDFQKSLENYSKAETILLNARKQYNYLLGAIYTRVGILYVDFGDYTKALTYFEKAIKIIDENENKNELVFSNVQLNLAQTYYFKKEFKLAIEICSQYLKSKNAIDRERFERIIGSCLIGLEQYSEAIAILEKSLIGFKNQPERYTEALLTIIKAHIRSGNMAVAEQLLARAVPLLAANKPDKDPWNIYYHELRSEFLMKKAGREVACCAKQQLLGEALKAVDKALLMNSSVSNGTKIPYIDTTGEFITPTQVADLLINRATILNNIADNYFLSSDKISGRQFQLLSLKTWEATVRFMHYLRVSFLEDESKLSLSGSQRIVNSKGFALAGSLYAETGRDEYFQKMLFFSESAKSATFLASLNASQAKNFGGIPDSLLARERELTMQLSAMNQLIYNAQNSATPDTVLFEEWKKNQFNIQKQHDELLFRFEREYPNYYRFKYNNQLIAADVLQMNLRRKQALIEYFIEEPATETDTGRVNILLFTKKGYHYFSKAITHEYVKSLATVLEQLTNHNVGDTKLSDFTRFVKASNYLYSVLIEPLGLHKSVTDLIIIPDGKLAYLPFDALISSVPETTLKTFTSYDYLVKRFNFVYSYSATLHYDYFRSSSDANSQILAFAPDYSNNDFDMNKAAYRTRQVVRNALRPLPGAREEVLGLSEHYRGKVFIGNDASEQRFKQEAGSYGILHLAMHTIMNDSIPMYSKLVFSPASDSLNDGFLNTQEIYNMKLNARMAVLSACNTGSGKMRTGEGVMSMARAFLYAGCPSIVMTLWEVEDKSSARLILNFYRNLFRGYSKPEALQRSKLDYLRNADPLKSHPYFWMGYIVVGDPSPIKYPTVVIISVLVFALIATVIFLFGKRMKRLLWHRETRKN